MSAAFELAVNSHVSPRQNTFASQVISTAPEIFTCVPHKYTVSRRLAQCLNPSLPSGVHLKAIEVCCLCLVWSLSPALLDLDVIPLHLRL